MRNFDENIFKYFQNGYGYSKRITLSFSNGITLGNADVVSEEFSIDQTLCDEENLTIGKVCPARMYVKIYDTQHSYKGQICTVSLSSYDDSDNLLASISLGTFTITSDNRTADKLYRELVGYDALYTLSKLSYLDKWLTYSKGSTKKTYSAFVSDFLDDVVLAISCTIDKQYVLNSIYNKLSTVTIKGNTGQNGLSYLDMLQMICESLGFFAFLDFKGELRFIPVKSTSTQLVDYAFTSGADGSTTDKASRLTSATKVSYVPADYFINGFNYEDYLTANYTKVSVVSENLDGEDTSDNYTTYSAGVSGVNYTVDCNILTKGWTSSQLMYILHGWAQTFNFANIGYKPSDLSKQYDPRIELGDYIQVTTPLNEVVIFPVLKRRISGIIAMRDNYIAGGDEISGTVGVSISSSSGATVGYAQIDLSNIKGAVITNSLIKDSTIENSKIKNATIDYAKMNSAFVGDLTSDTAFVNELQTNVLTAEFIQSAVADVGYLRAEYVQADETYSLISTIGQLSAELSLLKDVHITQSGKISGYLDAVEVNANSITAGKLIADHIYLKGDNGLLYQLNIDNQYSLIDDKPSDWDSNYANYFTKTYVLTSSEPSDWETNYYTDYYVSDGQGGYTLVQEQASVPTWQANTYYQVSYVANASSVWSQNTYYRHNSTPSTTTLDGNAITNRTITADHIVAGTITANEIASGTITADEIATNTITANKINLTDVFAQNITASGTITGVTLNGSTFMATNETTRTRLQLNDEGMYFYNIDTSISSGRIRTDTYYGGLYIGGTNVKIDGFDSVYVETHSGSIAMKAFENVSIQSQYGVVGIGYDKQTVKIMGDIEIGNPGSEVTITGSTVTCSTMFKANGGIRVGSHTSNIGSFGAYMNPNSVSIPNGSWTPLSITGSGNGMRQTLPAGTWIVVATVNFAGTTNGGRRGVRLYKEATTNSGAFTYTRSQQVICVDNSGSSGLYVSTVNFVVVEETSNVRIECLQDRGTALDVNASYISFIRIL